MANIIKWIGNGKSVHDPFLWTCPACDRGATITQNNRTDTTIPLGAPKFQDVKEPRVAISLFILCPNLECRRYSLYVFLYPAVQVTGTGRTMHSPSTSEPLSSWQLVPTSEAKTYPDYVPKAIRQDYTEAHLIRDLSPKASATLARRCLQGMIRDFYGVRKKNLYEDIEAIKDKVDPLTWQAIDAVRGIGNIGAHMEKDINVIVDVEPIEAAALLQLIESLIENWYIQKHEREEHLKQIVALNKAKQQARKQPPG